VDALRIFFFFETNIDRKKYIAKKKREERDTLINKKNSATFNRELHFSFLRIQQQQQQQDVYTFFLNIRIAVKRRGKEEKRDMKTKQQNDLLASCIAHHGGSSVAACYFHFKS
jgi:hypothetical protein